MRITRVIESPVNTAIAKKRAWGSVFLRAQITRACERGFTLVELIMVLVIFGVLVTMGTSLFFNVQAFHERGFFDQTVSAVRYAQKYAVASGCTVRVNIAAAGFSLWTATSAPACSNTAPCTPGSYGTAVLDPVEGTLPFGRNATADVGLAPAGDICFRPNGTTTLAVDTVVTVGTSQFRISAGSGFAQQL